MENSHNVVPEEHVAIKCFACSNSYHSATGHWFGERWGNVFYCGVCARHFFKWVAGHMKRKWSGASFYDEAVTSIRAKSVDDKVDDSPDGLRFGFTI